MSQAVSSPPWGSRREGRVGPAHHSVATWRCSETCLVVPTAVAVGGGDDVLLASSGSKPGVRLIYKAQDSPSQQKTIWPQ